MRANRRVGRVVRAVPRAGVRAGNRRAQRAESTETAYEIDEGEQEAMDRLSALFKQKRTHLQGGDAVSTQIEPIVFPKETLQVVRQNHETRVMNDAIRIQDEIEHGTENEHEIRLLLPQLENWLERVKIQETQLSLTLSDVRAQLEDKQAEINIVNKLEDVVTEARTLEEKRSNRKDLSK